MTHLLLKFMHSPSDMINTSFSAAYIILMFLPVPSFILSSQTQRRESIESIVLRLAEMVGKGVYKVHT